MRDSAGGIAFRHAVVLPTEQHEGNARAIFSNFWPFQVEYGKRSFRSDAELTEHGEFSERESADSLAASLEVKYQGPIRRY